MCKVAWELDFKSTLTIFALLVVQKVNVNFHITVYYITFLNSLCKPGHILLVSIDMANFNHFQNNCIFLITALRYQFNKTALGQKKKFRKSVVKSLISPYKNKHIM